MAGTYQDEHGIWCEVPRPIALAKVIRSVVLNALAYTNGEQKKAAQCLGITARQMGILVHKERIIDGTRRGGRQRKSKES